MSHDGKKKIRTLQKKKKRRTGGRKARDFQPEWVKKEKGKTQKKKVHKR